MAHGTDVSPSATAAATRVEWPRGIRKMTKPKAQLDAEIALALKQQELKSKLRPVEGLRIPAASRRELTKFWRTYPALRKGCVSKYGFDPIEDEAEYWRFGLAEPDHRAVLRDVRRNNNVFSLPLVKRWEEGELRA